ncbi:MAG: DUF6580 family putative transport protein [bacterium]
MKRPVALAFVAIAGALTAASLALAVPIVAAVGIVALAARRKGHLGLLLFAATTMAFDAILFGFVIRQPPLSWLGPVPFSPSAAATGIAVATRLSAAVAVNFALLDRAPATVILDGLRLPRRATAFMAAVVLAAHGVGEDARRVLAAQRLDGRRKLRPNGVARLLPPLFASGLRRAEIRKDALRLAGMDTNASFAPVIAVAAVAAAARLAFTVANISPTYAIVFLGGVLFGPRVGMWAGALAMATTDVMLTGLLPASFVNVPAMALLGLLGGVLRGLDWTGPSRLDAWSARLTAAAAGFCATMLFSLASDAVTWLMLPEARGAPGGLSALVVGGLLFNLIPAYANAVMFAAATPATVRAWRSMSLPRAPVAA